MRAYSLAVLAQCTQNGILATDKEIIRWVNEKLSSAKKSTQIRSFQDSTIANSLAILDLIDAIKPGVINYDVVTKGRTEKVILVKICIIFFLNFFCRKNMKMQNML